MAATAGDPRRVIFTSDAAPLDVSSFQMAKSRSKTIVFPSYEIDGQSTRPAVNFVTCRGCSPGTMVQMFSAPPRSEAYQIRLPSADHIGQISRAPSAVMAATGEGACPTPTMQICESSRWLCPCRHHCEEATPRAAMAMRLPSGDG